MSRFVSEDCYNILSRISDDDFEMSHIFDVFREEIPRIAQKYGIILLSSTVYEPVRKSHEMRVSEFEMYNATNGMAANNIQETFPIGNGGRVVVTAGIATESVWTEELMQDVHVISRLVYLLLGRANSMATLNHLTFNDQLTGISNETGLNGFMGKTLGRGIFDNYSSNFINIKNMKLINSRYTKEAGDAVMRMYAKKIEVFAREKGNGIAARLGGDNFLVFIEQKHEEEFLEYMNNLVIQYTREEGKVKDIKIESRIGYYIIRPGDGIDEAMRNADVAARFARKATYPDVVKFEDNMMDNILKIRQLEQNIPHAIDNKEFVVYYQPKVDISRKGEYKLNGAEALVRWKKDGQMISPGDFVPVLEKSGLITLIDYYVFEQVCVDIKDWIERGFTPVKVSSNFSRRHLQDSEFSNKVEAIIRKHNIDTSYIEIEITESYDDEDMQALMRFEQRMHELGVDLSVDDFGSGFSSIKMIKNIVADTIKLDKSIIDGIGNEGPDDIIISHIISMINNLGKKVIAEGVETEKQADYLRLNGCNNIQGFLFAKPCAKEEFEQYM